jgi:cytochrome c oxidase subunit 2
VLNQLLNTASSFAGDIDKLVFLITVCVGFWFILAEVVFFWLIFRFSEREGVRGQYVAGETWNETKWISIPHYIILAFDVLIVIAAVRVWVQVKQTTPPADETVRVIAQQWAWTFVHPGPDGKLDTADDVRMLDELHVMRDKVYHFELSAKDVLHSFSIPAFRLKQDAVPGRVIKGWFKPTVTGTYDIQCAEICGLGHALMPAHIVVENENDHARWLKQFGAVAVAGSSGPQGNALPEPTQQQAPGPHEPSKPAPSGGK